MGLCKTNLRQHHPDNISVVVFILLSFYFPCEATIEINEYGVLPVKSGDTAMVFYAHASNTGNESKIPMAARLKMESCCLETSENISVCNAMKLVDGNGIIIHPEDSQILKMYFISPDLYDREGSCILSLMTMPSPEDHSVGSTQHWEQGREITIPFRNGLMRKLFEKIKMTIGWIKKDHVCNSNNENAAQECANQDCLLRYNGARSFHNKTTDQCEPTPDCGDGGGTLLSPITGQCEALQDGKHILASFSREMVLVETKQIPHIGSSSTEQTGAELLDKAFHNIVCKHGVEAIGIDGIPNCTCIEGWRSLSKEEWKLKGSSKEEGAIITMCDVAILDSKQRGMLILAFLIIAMLTPVAALIICIHCQRKEDAKKQQLSSYITEPVTKDDDGPDEDEEERRDSGEMNKTNSDEVDADAVISEITNRRESIPRKPSSPPEVESKHSATPEESTSYQSHINANRSSKTLKNEDGTLRRSWNIPSTDELLTMKQVEKLRARVVLTRESSNSSYSKTPQSYAQASGNMNRRNSTTKTRKGTATNGLSTEKVTEVKKQEWAEYFGSEEQKSIPDHSSTSLHTGNGPSTDIKYHFANRPNPRAENRFPGAIKVQSMPTMKISTELPSSQEPAKKASINSMFSERLAGMPEAYNMLQSLSNPRLASTSDSGTSTNSNYNNNIKATGIPSRHSIWSNVASENATQPDPEVASSASSFSDVRVRSIYGIMEGDEDSDEALEKIADSKNGNKEKILTNAELFEYNLKLFGFPQTSTPAQLDNDKERYEFINSFRMESDRVPSEAFPETDSSTVSTSPSILNFWNQNETGRAADESNANLTESRWAHRFSNKVGNPVAPVHGKVSDMDGVRTRIMGEVTDTNLLSPELRSAYQIKSSLSNSLRAARSRSDSSILHF